MDDARKSLLRRIRFGTVLLVVGLAIVLGLAQANGTEGLYEAIRNSHVAIASRGIRGTGGSSGPSILIDIAKGPNAPTGPIRVRVPRGTILRNGNGAGQNMVVESVLGLFLGDMNGATSYRPSSDIVLNSTTPVTYVLAAYCTQFEKDNPSPSDQFTVEQPNSRLSSILGQTGSLSVSAIQAAVWMETDHITFEHLTEKFQVSPAEWAAAATAYQSAPPSDPSTARVDATSPDSSCVGTSCTDLGDSYRLGNGVPVDQRIAAQLYDRGCLGGDARGCTSLGMMYGEGTGVVKDASRAVALYDRGCSGNYPFACTLLGLMYEVGSGVPVDDARAATLYARSCSAGEPNGCVDSGNLKFNKKDAAGALADLSRAIGLDPTTVRAFNVRGWVKRGNGDIDGALEDLNAAVGADASNANNYFVRGLVRGDRRDFEGAVADLRRVIQVGPSESDADYAALYVWFYRARLGARSDATTELRAFLARRAGEHADRWPMPIARFLMGQLGEAGLIQSADGAGALTAKARECEAYFFEGAVRLLNQDKAGATSAFNRSVETHESANSEYASALAELRRLKAVGLGQRVLPIGE
jgi:lipoprotein NlpI